MSTLTLRNLWGPWARHPLMVITGLAVFFTALRAAAMLGQVAWRPIFLLHCVAMALTPWLLLDRAGRREVGLARSSGIGFYPAALLLGAVASMICFGLGWWLFGASEDHWFVSVGRSFRAQPTPGFTVWQLHAMFTIPAMLFSPIGEEMFFRGVFQRALESRFSATTSTRIESAWFAGAHLVHHGLVLTATGLSFRGLSGPLWFALMFALSVLFSTLRQRSGAIFPAMLAHSAFNGVMNACIFAWLW